MVTESGPASPATEPSTQETGGIIRAANQLAPAASAGKSWKNLSPSVSPRPDRKSSMSDRKSAMTSKTGSPK